MALSDCPRFSFVFPSVEATLTVVKHFALPKQEKSESIPDRVCLFDHSVIELSKIVKEALLISIFFTTVTPLSKNYYNGNTMS